MPRGRDQSLFVPWLHWMVLCLAIMGSGCMTRGDAKVKLSHGATIVEGKKKPREAKAGQVLRVGKEPMEIRSPRKVSLLIVPTPSSTRAITVALPDLPPPEEQDIKDWLAKQPPPECPKEPKEAPSPPPPPPKCPDPGPTMDDLNRLLTGIRKAQLALSRREPKEAMVILNTLQIKYPDLAYLELIKASSLYMLSDLVGARVSLDKALKVLPDDEDARKLLLLLQAGGTGGLP